MKEYEPSLLRIFAAEQREHVERIRAAAESLAETPPEARRALFDELLRRAHTLKGAARAVGIDATERLSHAIEALFGRIRSGAASLDERALRAYRQALDSAEDVLAAALAGRPEPDVAQVVTALGTATGEPPAPEDHPEVGSRPSAPSAPAEPEPERPAEVAPELVRVSAERIDEVVRGSSQMLAVAAGAAADARRAAGLQERIEQLDAAWRQLRRASAGFARLRGEDVAYAPALDSIEIIEDRLRAAAAEAAATVSATERHAWELEKRSRELHSDARRIRMITADAVFAAFGSMVRDLARAERKQIEFHVEGLDVQADRLVLQGLKDAVMHLMRNAVTHAIEPAPEREAAGKPAAGLVSLRMCAHGDRLEVAVEDDGRGLDLGRIAAVAVAKGLLPAEAASSMTITEAARLILQPGFSTAGHVTALAGRGMGLSVVREAARTFGGDVAISPAPRFGTLIEISVPLSISTQRVLLLDAAGSLLGVPAAAVERLWRGPVSEVKTIEGRQAIVLDGVPVTLARLADLLGLEPAPGASPLDEVADPKLQVAVLVFDGERAGMIVDRFLDDRDATVTSLGLPATLAGISAGGVPLEDGTVVVILDAAATMERFRAAGASPAIVTPALEAKPKARILVVDDSLTTRSLEKSILEAHGYDVRVAVDGVQALEELRGLGADLVITDVMMPRMDGLELLGNIKADKTLAAIPVIVVTSLDRREDQERGLSLGADAYIVKRKFDQRELLKTVRQIL